MERRVAYADIKELTSLDDPFEHVVFIVLGAEREATFECGVVGDDCGYVRKRLRIDVATDTLPAVNLAGQQRVDAIGSRPYIQQLDAGLIKPGQVSDVMDIVGPARIGGQSAPSGMSQATML